MRKIFIIFFAIGSLTTATVNAQVLVEWQVRTAHACGNRLVRKALGKACEVVKHVKNCDECQALSRASAKQSLAICLPFKDIQQGGSVLQTPVYRTTVNNVASSEILLTTADLDRIAFACIQNLYVRVAQLETQVAELEKTRCACTK